MELGVFGLTAKRNGRSIIGRMQVQIDFSFFSCLATALLHIAQTSRGLFIYFKQGKANDNSFYIAGKQYEIVNANKKCHLRVTPLFLESNPDSRYDIGVFGEAEFPHPPLPYSRHQPMLAFLGDQLYVIGGFNGEDRSLDHIYGKFVDRLDFREVKSQFGSSKLISLNFIFSLQAFTQTELSAAVTS